MRKIFASRLKECQLRLNLTQAKFSELINVAPGTLSAYLKQDKVPTLEKAVEIATKLGVTVGWLCGEDEHSNKSFFNNGRVSYATVINAINELYDIPWVGAFEVRSESVYSSFNNDNVKGISIKMGDPIIGKFYEDHQKVRELYSSNTIDREMYDAWVEKRLKELENEPLDVLPF